MKVVYVLIFSLLLVGCSKRYGGYYAQHDGYPYQYTEYSDVDNNNSYQNNKYFDRDTGCLNWHNEFYRCQSQYDRYSNRNNFEWYNRCKNQHGILFLNYYERKCSNRYNSHSTSSSRRTIIIPHYSRRNEDSSETTYRISEPLLENHFEHQHNTPSPEEEFYMPPTIIPDYRNNQPTNPAEGNDIHPGTEYQYVDPEYVKPPDNPPDIIDNQGELIAIPTNILDYEYLENLK